jgi:hypothetical protein
MSKSSAIAQLKSGLEQSCADDITEVLCNLSDGTCDYVELIPLLEEVAERDFFYYFDDNGAGGFPHPSGEPSSFRDWALKAIENIKENTKFDSSTQMARDLKSIDIQIIKSVLNGLTDSNCRDEKLIPILEKIAEKDEYQSYSYYGGFSHSPRKFREPALKAIQQIRKNIEEDSQKVESE